MERKLDIGCGTGSSCGAYDTGAWMGIDSDPESVAVISRKYPDHTFLVADAEHLPFSAGFFRSSTRPTRLST